MRPILHLSASLSALAIAALTIAAPALAETNTVAAPSLMALDTTAAAGDGAASDDASGDSTGLTEIVVTATKRETNLQKTPISIAVLGMEDIKKRHVQSLIDLADGGIPSLRVATFESRQSAVTIGIRGIVPGDANQPAREQGVGVYIDGVYLGRQHGLNTGLLDVERIEVLKGPQGTLFGRNTEGGALSIVSKGPSGEFGGRANFGFGNYGSYSGAIHLDLPAFANIAIKLDAAIQHQDPTTKNPLAGQAGWNEFHRYGGRVSAQWKPSSDFTALVSYDTNRDENTPFYSQLINYNPNGLPVATLAQIAAAGNRVPAGLIAPLAPVVVIGAERQSIADVAVPQNPSIGKTSGFVANLKWQAGADIELRSITAWRKVSDEQWDNSGGAHRTPVFLPNTTFSRYSLANLKQRQFSQELQAVGSFGAVDFTLGLYYFNETVSDVARTPNTNTWNADGTAYTINNPLNYLTSPVSRASRATAKSYAAYGNVTYNVSEAFQITAGGRYTHDKKNGLLFTVNGAATNFTFEQTNNRFDPLIVLSWAATPDVNLYAKYATGYRAGGASSRSVVYRQFGPESVKSYEVGIKSEFLDRRVRLNLAGYIMDRANSQVDFNAFLVDPNTNLVRNTLETVNAEGTTKIRGIEADLTVRPVDGLTMGLSYAYTYSAIPDARNTIQEAKNIADGRANLNPVIQKVFVLFTPKNALSGNLDYELPVGSSGAAIKFHMDASYSDPVYSFDNENVLTEKSFIVNARLSLADIKLSDGGQKLTVSAWARNLFNESHIYRRSNANRAVLGDYANFNAPRTFGLDASLSF